MPIRRQRPETRRSREELLKKFVGMENRDIDSSLKLDRESAWCQTSRWKELRSIESLTYISQ